MEDVSTRVDEFITRLNSLYANIREWLSIRDIRFSEFPVELNEEETGRYSVNGLVIMSGSEERVASITPVGRDVIAAEGMIRIIGLYGSRTLLYFTDGGPQMDIEKSINGESTKQYKRPILTGIDRADWYMISNPKTGEARRLDRDLLLTILREVSDYGV